MTQLLVAAHRGLSAKHPENTLEAFQAAAAEGFHAIELDVRITHDGVVVVMHDANIARTTDGVGRVADFDWPEMRSHETAAGPIPTLAEALQSVPDWTGLWNIEIKASPAAEPAAAIVQELNLQDRVIFTCMDPDALMRLQTIAPEVERGLITLGKPDLDDLEAAQETGCTWMMVDHEFITDAVAHQIRGGGLQLGAWTVNDPDEAAARVEQGATMIITDTQAVLAAIAS